MFKKITNVMLAAALMIGGGWLASAATTTPANTVATSSAVQTLDRMNTLRQIRKELVTLPFVGVFDNLAYQYENGKVILSGQVVRPTTRSDAGNRVKRIKGVEQVVNNIEVLPLSSFDDSIRVRAYRTIFNTGGLYRYALGANPSVRIVVNRGNITLEGMVANRGDARLAYIAARGVPGAFSVTNNLRVENREAS